MFRTLLPGRTSRAIAAGALIFSLAATTFVGSASAAPLANNGACSAASQTRTDAVHALHDAWKASLSELKTLATNGHGLGKEVFTAWRDLKAVLMQSARDLKDLGFGAACDDDEDATPPTDSSALDVQVKAIVDKAIADMKAVVDAARTVAAATPATTPADTTKSADDEKDNDEDAHGAKVNKDEQAENDKDANEDQDDDKDNSSEESKAGSTDLAAKMANVAKVLSSHRSTGSHDGRNHERD